MQTRLMQYTNPPRQTAASGRATLVWPLKRLLLQFIVWFLRQAIRRLWNSRRPENLRPFLEKADLGESAITLDEFLHVPVNLPKFEFTTSCLAEYDRFAADHADEDGSWRDLGLDETVEEAVADLEDRFRQFVRTLRPKCGPEAVECGLRKLHGLFRDERDRVRNETLYWSSEDAQQLLDYGRRLRSAARPPRWYWNLLSRLCPQLSPKLWLTKAQQTMIRRRCVPAILRAAQLRTGIAVRDAKLELYERLLGRPAAPGVFDRMLRELRDYKGLIRRLASSLPAAPASDHADAILLVESIHDQIDPSERLRVKDVFFEMARRARTTPQGLADLIQREGIVVNGVARRPAEWPDEQPAKLASALVAAARHYLGFRGWDSSPDIEQPQTAVDFIASITLSDPILRPLVERCLPEFSRRSLPYATFPPIAGADPKTLAFLFCHPTQRKTLEDLLLVEANLSNPANAEPEIAHQYQIDTPYAAMLLQYALACPGGAQVDLQRAMRHPNRTLAANKIPSLFQSNQNLPEVRLLPHRPDEYDDARHLFRVAADARIIVPVGSGEQRYNLLKTEPRLGTLFAPDQFVADWKTAEVFQTQLRTGDFVDFVQAAYSHISDWITIVQQLRAQSVPEQVADELVKLGILEANPHGLYRMTQVPSAHHTRLPYGLYRPVSGPMRGMSEDEFVAELIRNDWLYNTLFWQVADALDQERICPSEVPGFVNDYLQTLG